MGLFFSKILSWIFATSCNKKSLEATTLLWSLIAPLAWLKAGRRTQYSSASTGGSFSAVPSIRIYKYQIDILQNIAHFCSKRESVVQKQLIRIWNGFVFILWTKISKNECQFLTCVFSYLTIKVWIIKQHCDIWIRINILSFVTSIIREKSETIGSVAFEQHHSRWWFTVPERKLFTANFYRIHRKTLYFETVLIEKLFASSQIEHFSFASSNQSWKTANGSFIGRWDSRNASEPFLYSLRQSNKSTFQYNCHI